MKVERHVATIPSECAEPLAWLRSICRQPEPGAFTPQQAMDRLASEMDLVMSRMQSADEKAGTYGGCGPRLNEESDPSVWLKKAGSPKAKVNEKPPGQTVNYDELIKRWKN